MTFILTYVLFPFVTAPALLAELPPSPDPTQGPVICHITYQMMEQALAHARDPVTDPRAPAIAPAPTRILHLLGVVRALIAFGNQLAATLRANPPTDTIRNIGTRFGTVTVAIILARITRGLRLAAALEAKFAPRANRPDPAQQPTPRAPASASAPRQPRKPRRPITAQAPLPQNSADAILAALPTAQEIAERLRTRSLAAVLQEICSDLGLVPADPLWRDVVNAGGPFLAMWKDAMKRTAISNFIPPNVRFVWPKQPSLSDLALAHAERAATGPP